MGASQSTNPAVATSPAVPPALLTKPGFRVKVTHDGQDLTAAANDASDPVQQAYLRGKQEGTETIHRALDQVAAQVYDNIHEQLMDQQRESLAKTEAMVTSIKAKLVAPAPATKSCGTEESVLITCLQSNATSPLACTDLVQAYHKCAVKSVSSA